MNGLGWRWLAKHYRSAIAALLLVIGCAIFFPAAQSAAPLGQSEPPAPKIAAVPQREVSELYPIQDDAGNNGFIDNTGKMSIKLPPNVTRPHLFYEGLAAVGYLPSKQRGNDLLIGYVNKQGKFAIPPSKFIDTEGLDGAENFSEGLAVFTTVPKGNKDTFSYGYINKSGKIVIPAKFESAKPFSSGMAVVGIREHPTGRESYTRYTLIDKQGRFILKNPKIYADDRLLASEGLATVSLNEKVGFVDATGKFAIPPKFLEGGSFVDGLAPVRAGEEYENTHCGQPGYNPNSNHGYIDRQGEFIIAPQFTHAEPFSEGLAAVGIRDAKTGREKWGYIDRTGKFVIPLQFDGLLGSGQAFSEGLAAVPVADNKPQRNPLVGYIDRTGKFAVQPQFHSHAPFDGGLASAEVYYYGDVDFSGPEFSQEQEEQDDKAYAQIVAAHPNGFHPSQLSPAERAVLDRQLKRSRAQDSLFKGGASGYIDRQGKFVWKKEYMLPGRSPQ
jgi:hypothetical protein